MDFFTNKSIKVLILPSSRLDVSAWSLNTAISSRLRLLAVTISSNFFCSISKNLSSLPWVKSIWARLFLSELLNAFGMVVCFQESGLMEHLLHRSHSNCFLRLHKSSTSPNRTQNLARSFHPHLPLELSKFLLCVPPGRTTVLF